MSRIGVTGLGNWDGNRMVAESAGWWWPFTGAVIITERPRVLELDAHGRLHSASGMAIRYPDGWGFYSWHGRRVPEWVITDPSMERIAAEENIEIRRCAIESLGWDVFIREARLVPVGFPVSDPGNPGQYLALYDVPERLWGSRIRLLLCVNGSTERSGERRRYGLTVPATMENPLQAAAWTYRLQEDEYAQLVRRA